MYYMHHCGTTGFLVWRYLYFKTKRKELNLKISQFKHKVHLRINTTDLEVFQQSVIGKECESNLYNTSPKYIVDCGANIGMASIIYTNMFPKARIFSIEPDSDNFKSLVRNTKDYKNITPLNLGIWYKSCHIEVKNKDVGSWSFEFQEVNQRGKGTPAISISDLMSEYQIPKIDILKIDIEGAEKELLENNSDKWLPRVDTLVIELHDRKKEGCSDSLIKALSKYNCVLDSNKENIFCKIIPKP